MQGPPNLSQVQLGFVYTWAMSAGDPTDPRVRAAETKRLRTRQRLAIAALHVMQERGMEATVKDIAKRAGVSVPTFYNLYTSRNELCMDTLKALFNDKIWQEWFESKEVVGIEALILKVQMLCTKHRQLLKAGLLGRLELDNRDTSRNASEDRLGWIAWSPVSQKKGFKDIESDIVDALAYWFKAELFFERNLEERAIRSDRIFGLSLYSLALSFLEDIATSRYVDLERLAAAIRAAGHV